ncbi:hypothetical protein C8Q76DRAFT_590791, partial [Earliella scabrosa]
MIRKSDLQGFKIPGTGEKLLAALFADDTKAYLAEGDNYATLQDILDTWGSAAKAKFNLRKTEILPVGTPEFRNEMAETYHTTGTWRDYPTGIHVAREGEPVCLLGAWYGNGIDQVEVWSMVLTKIVAIKQPLSHALERWKTGRASIDGKRHVMQMIIGGMTQYLTNVQRMPEAIIKRLTKIIRNYLWDDRHNTPV